MREFIFRALAGALFLFAARSLVIMIQMDVGWGLGDLVTIASFAVFVPPLAVFALRGEKPALRLLIRALSIFHLPTTLLVSLLERHVEMPEVEEVERGDAMESLPSDSTEVDDGST